MTFTRHRRSGPGGTPTGSILWTIDGTAGFTSCSSTTALSGGVATCTITDVQAGTITAQADYSGDANYNASSGSDSATVNAADSATVVVDDSTLTTQTGDTVTFTATVSGPGGTPTGSILWTIGGTAGFTSCSSTTALSGGVATCTITDVQAGTITAQADYSGDANYNASSGSDSATVNAADSATVVVDDSTLTTQTGDTVTFTATVSGPGGTPTGSILWTIGGTAGFTSCSSTTALSGGVATCTITDVQAGTITAQADYSGDANYNASSGSDSATVNAADSATVVVDDSTLTTQTGDTVTFTATVSGPGGTPTGSILWTIGGTAGFTSCSSTTALSGGVATCTITDVQAGTITAQADYSGDANYNASSGSDSATVNAADSATVVVDDSTLTTQTGDTVTFTATVSGPGGTPTGSILWTIGGTAGFTSCSSTTALSGGVATCTITDVQAGTITAQADYSGDANYNASSGSDSATVNAADSATVVVDDSTLTTQTGDTVTFTATVSGPGGTPTGSILWTIGGTAGFTSCSSTTALSGGVATCTITDVQAGTITAQADYSGDANYNASSGSDSATVNAADSATVVVDDSTLTTQTGDTVTFTATVSGPGGTPTGSILWTIGGTAGFTSCSSTTALSGGVATCTITDVQAGTITAQADYSGDANYNASSGSDSATVNAADSATVVVDDSTLTTQTGDTVTFTATVSGPGGTPTGSILWTIGGTAGFTSCSSTTALSGGVATCTITDVQAGTITAQADYSGDANYNASSGSDSATVNPSSGHGHGHRQLAHDHLRRRGPDHHRWLQRPGGTDTSLAGVSCSIVGYTGQAGTYTTQCTGPSSTTDYATIVYVTGTLTVNPSSADGHGHRQLADDHLRRRGPDHHRWLQRPGGTDTSLAGVTCSIVGYTGQAGTYTTQCTGPSLDDRLRDHRLRHRHLDGQPLERPGDGHRELADHHLRRRGPDHHRRLQRPGGRGHVARGGQLLDRGLHRPGRDLHDPVHRPVVDDRLRDIVYATGTLTVNPSSAQVTVTASSPTITYGDAAPTITAGYSGLVGTDTSTRGGQLLDRGLHRPGRDLHDPVHRPVVDDRLLGHRLRHGHPDGQPVEARRSPRRPPRRARGPRRSSVFTTASSGLTVTYGVAGGSASGLHVTSGGVVSATGAGTCVIDLNQAGQRQLQRRAPDPGHRDLHRGQPDHHRRRQPRAAPGPRRRASSPRPARA